MDAFIKYSMFYESHKLHMQLVVSHIRYFILFTALLLGLGIPCIIEIVKGRAPPRYPVSIINSTAKYYMLQI